METWTPWTPEPPSEAVPQRPVVPQPAFQPAVEYVPEFAGKVVVEVGAVLSILNVREGPVSVLPASSVARTWTV